jgi:hypothetical protein
VKALFNDYCDGCREMKRRSFRPRCAKVILKRRHFLYKPGHQTAILCELCRSESRGKYNLDPKHKTVKP